ncbi:hypothetical protein JCM8547_000679 [Rhodosporidiobolus lusitaniae]
MRAIGSLMYDAMLRTPPDLTHLVGVLDHYAARPNTSHWTHPRVASSSKEAEYLGLSHADKKTVFLGQLLCVNKG